MQIYSPLHVVSKHRTYMTLIISSSCMDVVLLKGKHNRKSTHIAISGGNHDPSKKFFSSSPPTSSSTLITIFDEQDCFCVIVQGLNQQLTLTTLLCFHLFHYDFPGFHTFYYFCILNLFIRRLKKFELYKNIF